MAPINGESTCLQNHKVSPKDVDEDNVAVMQSQSQHCLPHYFSQWGQAWRQQSIIYKTSVKEEKVACRKGCPERSYKVVKCWALELGWSGGKG